MKAPKSFQPLRGVSEWITDSQDALADMDRKMRKAIDRGVRRGSPKFVGTVGGIDVYVHDTVPKNTMYLIDPTQMKYEPMRSFAWKREPRPRSPFSYSYPYPRR